MVNYCAIIILTQSPLSYAAGLWDVISTNVNVLGGGNGGRECCGGNPQLVSISATFYFIDHAVERFQV